LRQVHVAIGGARHDFGGHTFLLAPDQIAPVAARGFPGWWLDDAPPLALEAQEFLTFYEDSGDYICFEPGSSRAIGLGVEVGDVYRSTVEDVLARFFGALVQGRWPGTDELLAVERR
jgi:hypothetical protein